MRPINISGNQAKDYYYAHDAMFGNTNNSQWGGKVAAKFGLEGTVRKHHFVKIIAGMHPKTGEQLIKDGVSKDGDKSHRAAIDFPLTAPKSASILALHCGEEMLIEAHKKAVDITRDFIEKNYIYCRKTEDGVTRAFKTGRGIFSTFDHGVSRANDMHLHTHLLISNMTNTKDGYRALYNDMIFRNQTLIDNVYQSAYAKLLKQAGLNIVHKSNGQWDIGGVDQDTIDVFSKRRNEIRSAESQLEADGKPLGRLSREDRIFAIRDKIQQNTKGKKDRKITKEELLDQWQAQADREEIKKSVEADKLIPQGFNLSRAEVVALAVNAITENESTFSKRDVLIRSLQLSRGQYDIDEISRTVTRMIGAKNIVHLKKRVNKRGVETNFYTSPEMVKIEKNILQMFRDERDPAKSRGFDEPAPIANESGKRDWNISLASVNRYIDKNFSFLNDGQRHTIHNILLGKDRFGIVQGDAGTGKTTALKAAKAYLDDHNIKIEIIGLGYTGKSAMEIEKASGIQSKTIHSFLGKPPEKSDIPQIWLVDESSMVGSKQMEQVMALAIDHDAAGRFIGDGKQLKAINAGRMFDELQEHGRGAVVVLDEVLRQRTPEAKAIVGHIVDYKTEMDPDGIEKAFSVLQDNTALIVHEMPENRIQAAVDFYMKHNDALIVAPENSMRVAINHEVRNTLLKQESRQQTTELVKDACKISTIGKYFAASYQTGQIAYVSHSEKADLPRGKEYKIVRTDLKANTITLSNGNGESVDVDLKKDQVEMTIYQEKERLFFQGERIIFTKNDNAINVQNGTTGRIESIGANGVWTVNVDDRDKPVRFHIKHYQYLDHGHAVTIHKSQGQTCNSVAMVTDSTCHGNNYESLYVAMSRTTHNAALIVDDPEKVKKQFKNPQDKTSTIPFLTITEKDIQESKDHAKTRQYDQHRGKGNAKNDLQYQHSLG